VSQLLVPGRVETLLVLAQALVDALAFDEHGVTVAGEFRGGNGGLLSNESIAAEHALRRELLVWKAAEVTGKPRNLVTTLEPSVSGQNSAKTPPESITPPAPIVGPGDE